jgi:hypothetical protein
MRRVLVPLLLAFAWVAPGAVLAGDEAAEPAKPPHGAPDLETGIRRGVEYLLKSQNKDGSWGSPASNLYDIYAPVPGAFEAFHVAASALALSGLLEVGGDAPEVMEAVRRATDFLVAKHLVKRVSADTLYNTWAHAYSLETFARLLAREKDEAKRKVYLDAAAGDVERLARYQFVEGGWGYYDFDIGAKDPGPGSTTFTTATALVAMKMAADQGVAIPDRLVEGGLRLLRVLRFPRGSFAYSYDHRYWPQGGINKIKGSLARTPACLLAFRDWSADEATTDQIRTALDELEKEGRFLLIARKYPRPHETWYQNSGYFCFYGYYYASRDIALLPAEERATYQKQIAGHLLPLQEEDGSFWDYQLYSYHKAYGTGYVLMTLGNCRAAQAAN